MFVVCILHMHESAMELLQEDCEEITITSINVFWSISIL